MSPLEEKASAPTLTNRSYIPWIVAVVGLSASFGGLVLFNRHEEKHIQSEFKRRVESTVHLIENALKFQKETLYSLRDLFHYSDHVTASEFESVSRELMKRHRCVRALKWAPRISSALRPQYEETLRHNPGHHAGIIEFRDGILQNATGRPDYFPITYDVSVTGHVHPAGWDLVSSTIWGDFLAAGQAGMVRASGYDPFPDTNKPSRQRDYWMELPVYLSKVPTSPEQRAIDLRGFVICAFDPSGLLEMAMGQMPRAGIDIAVFEQRSGVAGDLLAFRPSSSSGDVEATAPGFELTSREFYKRATVSFAGQVWELWFRPTPEWLQLERTHSGLTIFLCGLLSTAAFSAWLRLLLRRSQRVEELVAHRTSELTKTQQELRDDIRRRVETELALKASEERYRTFVSQSSDAVWRLELPQPIPTSLPLQEQIDRIVATGFVAECNDVTAELYGRRSPAEVLSKRLSELQAPGSLRHDTILRVFITRGYRLAEHEETEAPLGGQPRTILHNLIGVVENDRLARIWVTEKDLTQQKIIAQEKLLFERRLNETQRLESLGVLAGGIAHDFNNLLTGILGHASLARTEIADDSPIHGNLQQIEDASRSAASLCQQMLAYAGKGRFIVKRHNLSLIVSQTAHLLHVSIGKKADLRFNLSDTLPPVMADATQLQQIVMNLVINGAEAVGSHPGIITLTTGVIHPNAETFSGCPYAPAKIAETYVFLEVRDNGHGMPPEVLSRIFEPFFTTKFSGRGLGLAAALGIVRSHEGALRVESTPGQGSTFTLYLPAIAATDVEEPPTVSTSTPWSSDGTVLIVDDEAPVREVARRMAQTLGYKTLIAEDGQRGLEVFRQSNSHIGVVLLDVTMPGITGEETLSKLREISPGVHVVMMSGYNRPENIPPAPSGAAPVFLSKPFTMAQFQSALRRATKQS